MQGENKPLELDYTPRPQELYLLQVVEWIIQIPAPNQLQQSVTTLSYHAIDETRLLLVH